MKKFSFVASLAVAAFIAAPQPVQAVEVLHTLTGLHINKADAFQGYTLFTPTTKANATYLVDMQGNLVHKWNLPGKPFYAELLKNGNLLVNVVADNVPVSFGGQHGRMLEMDWDGKVLWEYTLSNKDAVMHHGFDRMPNGNTLVLVWERKNWDEARKAGRQEDLIPKDGSVTVDSVVYDAMWPDVIQEVDKAGKVVWEWHVWDHLGMGPDKINVNFSLNEKAFGQDYHYSDLTHFNAVRYDAKNDKIVCDSRSLGEIFIIDHKTGKIEWRFGNPGTYGGGKLPGGYGDDGDQQLFGCHDVNVLPNGHFSIFDNGTNRPAGNRSRVLEIDPKTSKIVWEFGLDDVLGNSFYSSYQGAAQYLPNSNYFVTSTMNGHIFEVSPTKEVVWEYVNPIHKTAPVCLSGPEDAFTNMVHRAFRYAPDYPAFQGKDLKPQGPLNPGCPDLSKIMAPYVK